MGFRGQVHDRVGAVLRQDAVQRAWRAAALDMPDLAGGLSS